MRQDNLIEVFRAEAYNWVKDEKALRVCFLECNSNLICKSLFQNITVMKSKIVIRPEVPIN